LVGKAGVESGAVIEGFDVVEDGSTSLGEGGEAVMIDQFVFETAKEALDKGIERRKVEKGRWRKGSVLFSCILRRVVSRRRRWLEKYGWSLSGPLTM
jgi:hypothetical protein